MTNHTQQERPLDAGQESVSLGRSTIVLAGIAAAIVVMIGSKHLPAAQSGEALRMLVMIFAILTGFIMAIFTISGNPAGLYPGSWRMASAQRRHIALALIRYRLLFYSYLLTMSSAVATSLLVNVDATNLVTHWLNRWTLSIGTAALIWSFGLPKAITDAQVAQLEAEIERRLKAQQEADGKLLDEYLS